MVSENLLGTRQKSTGNDAAGTGGLRFPHRMPSKPAFWPFVFADWPAATFSAVHRAPFFATDPCRQEPWVVVYFPCLS